MAGRGRREAQQREREQDFSGKTGAPDFQQQAEPAQPACQPRKAKATCYAEQTVNQFERLGLDLQCAMELACKTHAHLLLARFHEGQRASLQGVEEILLSLAKRLVINAAKSEIVHFNLRGNNVPVVTLAGARLARADSFRDLGMLFTKQRNLQASADYMCAPFLAGCRRIRRFASEHHLTDRPHTMLWLTKAYALPASIMMYACQICGTRFMREGAEMDCPLQTMHLRLLKRILGVKRATPNWSVLPVRFYNALLHSNSTTLSK
eukprot:1156733-Pelagomonas_calceolata.AAC.4